MRRQSANSRGADVRAQVFVVIECLGEGIGRGRQNSRRSSGRGLRSVIWSGITPKSCHGVTDSTRNGRRLRVSCGLATLDRVLALLVLAIAGTGLLALKAGAADGGWVFTVHGLVGGALLAGTLLKARRSVPPAMPGWSVAPPGRRACRRGGDRGRADRRLRLGRLGSAAHARVVDPAHDPCLVRARAGAAGRRPPPAASMARPATRRRTGGVSRRAVLTAGGLAVAGVGAFVATASLDRLLGGVRRFTGLTLAGTRQRATGDDVLRRATADDRHRRLASDCRWTGDGARRPAGARRGRPDRRTRLHLWLGRRDDLAWRAAERRDRHPRQWQRPRPVGDRLVDGSHRGRGAGMRSSRPASPAGISRKRTALRAGSSSRVAAASTGSSGSRRSRPPSPPST